MRKPRRVEFSPQALLDLEEIADFIAEDNPDAAERWVERLTTTAEKVGTHPEVGRVVPEYAVDEVREVFLRTYRIIYRVESSRVLVLTVIEGHRRLRK